WLLAAAAGFGLAMTSKFSAVFIVPVCLLLYVVRWIKGASKCGVVHFLRSFAIWVAVAYATIALVYAPEFKRFIPGMKRINKSLAAAMEVINIESPPGLALATAAKHLGIPSNSFFEGFAMVAWHNQQGHQSYLLGETGDQGWWYYFPVVFAVKTPTGVLI